MKPRTKRILAITGALAFVTAGAGALDASAGLSSSSMAKSSTANSKPSTAKSKSSTAKSSMAKSSTAKSSTAKSSTAKSSTAKSSKSTKSPSVHSAHAPATTEGSGSPASGGALRVISYNVKFGQQYRRSETCSGALAKQRQSRFYDMVVKTVQSADVVALQEVDKNAERSCSHDQPAIIAERLTKATGKTWKACFAKGREVEGGHQGNAVLSSYPGTTCLGTLTLGHDATDNEKRVAARAQLTLAGKSVRVYSVHTTSGEGEVSARSAQAKVLLKDMAMHKAGPVIAAGDFNSDDDSSITTLRQSATDVLPRAGVTNDTVESGGQLDHVFSVGTNTSGASVMQTDPDYKVSDHLPIHADLAF